MTDSLTGLGNRALLFDRLEFLLAQRNRGGLCVAFVDLNGFKAVNDRYGHGSGDELLVVVAERLRAAARRGDVLVRLGGDEFVVLGECDDQEASCVFRQRLELALSGSVRLGDIEVPLSASVGVAFVSSEESVAAAALLSRADKAMYLAKRER